MASSVLEMIKEEVTCPICLELMKEPVSADCNHSFCQACITLNYESNRNTEGEGNCPVCRIHYQFGNLRPNRHVANIVERMKGFKSIPEEEKVIICAQHGEKLQLFCKKDMMAICWLCERSQQHRGHQTALIEEVDHEYKEKLQEALQNLKKKEKICDEWQDALQQQRTDLENQIQSNVENVQMEFKGLREFLDSKENEELQELKKEKDDIMKILKESENELEEQRELLRALISNVEHQLELSTMEMLQNVNHVLTRSQTLKLKQPQRVPPKRRRVFQAPNLKGMLQAYQGLMDVQQYWVHMTLHAKKIAVIDIKNEVQIQHKNVYSGKLKLSETYKCGVLGYPSISSGKHYWEVDLSRSFGWLLGLNDGRCAPPQFLSVDEILINTKHNTNVCQHGIFQPNNGYWVIGRYNESVYKAFDECSITQNSSVLALSLTCSPKRVGVFLDKEAGTLSFYDVSNCGALIYRFYYPYFPQKVYPYFNPMKCSEPITVCGPPL